MAKNPFSSSKKPSDSDFTRKISTTPNQTFGIKKILDNKYARKIPTIRTPTKQSPVYPDSPPPPADPPVHTEIYPSSAYPQSAAVQVREGDPVNLNLRGLMTGEPTPKISVILPEGSNLMLEEDRLKGTAPRMQAKPLKITIKGRN